MSDTRKAFEDLLATAVQAENLIRDGGAVPIKGKTWALLRAAIDTAFTARAALSTPSGFAEGIEAAAKAIEEKMAMITSISGATAHEHVSGMARSVLLVRSLSPSGGERASIVADDLTVKGHDDRRVFFYERDFYVLSNFSAFSLRLWGGIRFDTSEAAYHWAKFDLDLPASREVQNNIYHARSAHDAFKIAEKHKHLRRPDWDDVKVGIMRDILRAKADQHEYVRRKLLQTGTRELIENSWRDDFWGWGPNGDGKNMLGKLWMEIRADAIARRDDQRTDHTAGGG